MDKKAAWRNFMSTGLVSDYLEYSKLKKDALEDTDNADKYRRPDYNRKNNR